MTSPHSSYEVMQSLLNNLRDLAKQMSETKKITTTDYVEIMLLEPHGDTYEAYRDYVKCFHNAINESVCNGILKRLINMAVVIEDEPNGIRKIKMLEIYSRTEKELDEWKSRYITD